MLGPALVKQHSISGKCELPGIAIGIMDYVLRNQHRLTCGLLLAGVKGLRHKVRTPHPTCSKGCDHFIGP